MTLIPVIDFRRQSMVLQWNTPDGTWTACDLPPDRVNGIALIRAGQSNVCLFAADGILQLQVGAQRYVLADGASQIRWRFGLATFGLRRRFSVESGAGETLFGYSYWRGRGEDFFSWLGARTTDPAWRAANGPRWSEGLPPTTLRES